MNQIDKSIYEEMEHVLSGEIIKYRAKNFALSEQLKTNTDLIIALEKREQETTQLVETLDMKLYLLREQLKTKDDSIIALQKKIYNRQYKYKNNHK